MSRVVVKTTYVPLPPSPAPLPDRVDLSLFDALWICFAPIQRLLLFRGSHVPPLPALLDSLRSALSRTLLHYFTLAGKLTYAPASDDVFIDCSPAAIGPGVAFFEAEYEGGDLGRLADDEVHNVDAFVQLIPELNATELPAPVFTVQVTRFRGAEGSADQGVALGFAAHHSVVDGRALWRFVEAWAVECHGEAGPPPPSLDRSVIKHPKGKEIARMFLHRMSPCLDVLTPTTLCYGAEPRTEPRASSNSECGGNEQTTPARFHCT
ncbi:malonyl-CoA:anthocyanidin 5-O-glucoside-6''-O-malonyltransferase [Canna indica]|uniref:Malonyl-CoA:anthocyanidin 5-O-glucoside-6''-O-malonyltransferase n=1 Tax=Canna indica TaxID=4628 RepID=A0AAQ3Q738_9LILI|nr:malonyl-CoA:anthocyanidin 5-O-glucoside-6''-O-malonyltransferase [Canna indica]